MYELYYMMSLQLFYMFKKPFMKSGERVKFHICGKAMGGCKRTLTEDAEVKLPLPPVSCQ